MKILLSLLLFLNLYAQIIIPIKSKQLLVVSSTGFNNPIATLQAYEKKSKSWTKKFSPISVNLGRNGLGWGKGEITFKIKKSDPFKQEGDGKAPAGLFSLDAFFGYEDRTFNFPYLHLGNDDICVDDSNSAQYNKLILSDDTSSYKSYEKMLRKDGLYELGIVVGHNKKGIKKVGSCIFIHIHREKNSPTSGCTSMSKQNLLKIMNWLDHKHKPLLLQLPYKQGFK